jgi:hypothetical protein
MSSSMSPDLSAMVTAAKEPTYDCNDFALLLLLL